MASAGEGAEVKCSEGHAWEDCKCPQDKVDVLLTRRAVWAVVVAVLFVVVLAAVAQIVGA